MHKISFSLAKPGKAMPGPYSSLMVLRRRASRSGAGRAVRGRKTQDNADTALIRLFTSNKDGGTCRAVARAARASEKGIRRVHAGIVSNLPNHSAEYSSSMARSAVTSTDRHG